MNRTLRISLRAASGLAAALALLAGASIANAEEATGVKLLRPAHGMSTDVGSKHVVGYFVANKGTCDLTFLMSDKQTDDDVLTSSSPRFKQVVAVNSTARVDTAEGESLELTCQPGASAMSVRLLKQVASYKDAK